MGPRRGPPEAGISAQVHCRLSPRRSPPGRVRNRTGTRRPLPFGLRPFFDLVPQGRHDQVCHIPHDFLHDLSLTCRNSYVRSSSLVNHHFSCGRPIVVIPLNSYLKLKIGVRVKDLRRGL